jgi:ABC-2 type transport system permease protein
LLQTWFREYRQIFGDAGAILIFFGAILIYPFFYPIPYEREVLRKVPIAVVDMDHSRMSRDLARRLDAHELLRVVARPASVEEARDLFYSDGVNGFVVIPKDFFKNISRGKQATIAAYCDASYFLLYRQVLTGVIYSAGTLSAGIEVRRAMAKGTPFRGALKARDPIPLLAIPLFNPGSGYATYVVPPVLLIVLQQTLLIGIGMMRGTARSRKGRRPAPSVEGNTISSVLGKTLAYLTIYLFHAVYIIVILFRIYRFPQRGFFPEIMLFLLPFLLSVIFLGFTIAAFFKERETSMVALLCTSIPAVFLVGISWPAEAIPGWLRTLSFLIPSTLGVDGFLRMNCMGASLRDVATQWGALWGLSLLYFAGALLVSRMTARKDSVALPGRETQAFFDSDPK